MKRRWASLIVAALAMLVIVATAVPVLAQGDEEGASRQERIYRPALAIHAPRRAAVGDSVTMTVVQKGTQDPVKDAAIWALTQENAQALKAKIEELRAQDVALRDVDLESLVSPLGFFLGTTHGNGQLKYTFTDEGRYLLIALKQGYFPGRTSIAIMAPLTDNARGQ